MQRKSLATLAAAATAALLSLGVYAATAATAASSSNDAGAMPTSAVSLTQAVASAETHAGGKASKAEAELNAKGRWVYDVEVVAGSRVFDVQVDANSGSVLSATEDKVDHDDEHDEKD